MSAPVYKFGIASTGSLEKRTSQCKAQGQGKKIKKEEFMNSEHDSGFSTLDASVHVQGLLKLSAAQLSVLSGELEATSEDPVLVVQVNPDWVDMYGQRAADDVLDFIGEFEMGEGERRDPEVGRRFLYHFNFSSDIGRCEDATEKAFPLAFALSPRSVARAVAHGARGIEDIPLAFCAVVHKVGICQDDVERSKFFILDLLGFW